MSWQRFCNEESGYINSLVGVEFDIFLKEFKSRENKIVKPKPSHINCPKCGKNIVWIDVLQTRSGDEGATSFFMCDSCKYSWTMN